MPNVLSNGPFVCCEGISGEAEDRYLHLCQCPSAKLVTTQNSKVASIIGFDEIGVAHPALSGLSPSVPPVKYLRRERVFNYNRTVTFDSDSDCSGSTKSQSSTSPTSVFRTINATDGTITDGSPIVLTSQNYNCIDGETQPAGGPSSTSYPQGIDPAISGATYTQTSISITFDLSDEDTTGSDTRSEFLSVPDTEQNAIDRATEYESTAYKRAVFAYSDRNTGYTFDYETAEYAIVLQNLVVGVDYRVNMPVNRSEYIEGQSLSYTEQTPIQITHTATKSFYIHNGTLNSSISDEDFENNNYSVFPSVYGLGSGELVITPTGTIPVARGFITEIAATGLMERQ